MIGGIVSIFFVKQVLILVFEEELNDLKPPSSILITISYPSNNEINPVNEKKHKENQD